MAERIEGPWLIQRLSEPRGDIDPSRGFDGFFGLDYMGAAEFEFGTVGENLRAFRARGKAQVIPILIDPGSGSTVEVYLVISAKGAFDVGVHGPAERARMEIQAHVNGDRTKEYAGFREAVRGEDRAYANAIAWWALTGSHTSRDATNYAWSLDRAIAERLALAFNTKKKES